MPISAFDLADDRKTATLEFGADTLTVTYRPNQMTPARELAIIRQARSEAAEDSGDDEELARAEYNVNRQLETFVELVEAWDFMGPLAQSSKGDRLNLPRSLTDPLELAAFAESKGGKLLVPPDEVVPIRTEFLRLIGSNFLMKVVNLLNEDMRPKQQCKR